MVIGNSVKCSDCGQSLDNLPERSDGEKIPCPNCGSKRRTISRLVSDGVQVSDHLSLLSRFRDKITGFRESIREGRAASADLLEDGTLKYSIHGTSPQGEEDTLSACHILVRKLNAMGANWLDPVIGEGVADCESRDRNDKKVRLTIQVIRAIIDEEFWLELNKSGGIVRTSDTRGLAVHIRNSIEKKASDSKIPISVRKGLTLALDATRLPAVAFEDVAFEFRSRFGAWSRELGFDSIWLIGPSKKLVWRLDSTDDKRSNEANAG